MAWDREGHWHLVSAVSSLLWLGDVSWDAERTKDGIRMEAWFSYLLLHDKHCHISASLLASSTYLFKPLWEWNRKDCQVESCVYSWVGVIFKFARFGDGVSRLSFCKGSIGFSYILQYMRNIPCFPPPLLKIHILCGVGECRSNLSAFSRCISLRTYLYLMEVCILSL